DNTAPAAPTTLLAADVAGDNGGAIVLNWALSTAGDVTQQRIYRGTATGGPYGTLVTTIPNNTTSTYTDNTGLTNGTTYYYVIRAYDGTQESGNSNQASAVPIDNTAPGAPTTLLAADVAGDNGGAIVLNWTLSASSDVTQQRLYRGIVSGGPYGTLVTTITNNTTSTYTDNTGLTNGTTYYYVIRAYDGTQESANSNQTSAVPIGDIASATNSVIAATSPVYADGVSVSTVTVTVKDNTNNPVAGATVTLSSSRGAADTITQPAGTTAINGQITGTVRSSTPGDSVISAIANGTINLVNTATINFYNTPAGSNVLVSPITSTEVTFTTVTGVGTTSAQQNPTGTPMPSGYITPTYYDISTTAAYTGTVSICITYNEAQYLGNESRVKLLHYETSAWVDRTSGPVDTVNNKVCGNVTSFSEFATGEATVPTITTAFLPDGTASASYSATLTASGGILPLTWSILTGSLPAGLSLNASTGVISGTPTTAGTSNFTVRVTDSNNATNDKALSIMIYSAISITTTSLPDGTAGAAYNQTVSATGGKTPYSWSIIAGSLPAGLSLNASTGVISGTPSVTGTSNFTIQVQDANSAVATQALSIAIYSPLSITTTALADGTVSVAYSQTLSATGGKTPYTWSITSGSLPAGLTLNPGTGVISGTPTATGASNFTVQVTDANSQIASRALSITIYSGVAITTAALPDGTVSLAYNTTLTATGGATPYTWSITLGALPPGLSLNPSTGLINGTPTASGTYPITVQVTDNNLVTNTKNLSITIFSAISVATSSLTDGTVNATYSQTLTASGGKTPYTWSITAGTLPSGLSLNSSTGVVSGTPSVSGTSNFTTQVTDANGATATRALSITIFSAISITTTSLPDGTVNLAYSQTLASSGGKTPYTWSIISGALPAGLSLNSITGAITGTPTASGASTFTAQVTDANGATATQALTITIYAVVTITTTTLPDGTVGAAYSTTVNVSGGKNPLVWGLSSGVLPTGLTINSSTGAITGNPTASGTYNFTIQVTDANGAVATQAYTITIYAAISITTTSLADGTVNASYSQTLTVSGGKSPFTWTLSGGALPAGLALAGSTGVISGTPTVAGTSNFTVQATDSNGATAPRVLSITIYPALSMTTNALSDGTVSLAYSQTLVASGGKSPLSWSITAGALPTGLGLAGGTGVISGTPTAAGTFNFTVQVTDANGAVASRALSIVIYSAISVTTTSLADGTVGVAYSQTVSASGGKTPYNWSIPSGSLPTGLSLNNGTGGISGTPTVAGTSNFTIRATDANGATADQALSIAVYNPLSVTTTALASGTINLAYSQTLVASGGKTPYNWSVIAGTLPTGLSLAGGTGVISGTPTVTGTWNFTVQAADSGGRTTGQALSITIYSGLTITTASLSDGTVTASYSATLAASGGQSPYTWAITVGILPSGLTLNGSTGVISGTPALAGSYPITVQVTDSNLSTQTKDFTITIYGAVSVTTAALSDGTVNAAYSQTLAASGGKTPYTWSITLGSLPTGLVLNGVSGGISGTPSASGTFNFTVQVTDANGAVASRALSILVYSAISVTTTALSDGTVNLAYSQTLSVSGGKTPLTWSISTGTLPAGLSLAGGTGVISGTPTTAGTSNFTVQVVDANGAVATRALSIVIYGAVSVTTASLPDGMVGSSYSQTLSAAGGKTPYAWNISVGSLPAGLGLNGSTGAISGIPTAAGTSNFTIQVTDANGATAAQALSVTVYATLTVTTSALPDGTVNLAYNATMTATGGKAPVGWSITVGVLPAGLSLNGSTGVISGTPTTASTSNITVRVTDANGFISDRSLSITIYGAISISTTSLPDGTVNGGYSATVVGIGGKTPYSWSITLGALPAGLALNSSTGVISGVPTTAGTSNFTVQVTDNNSATATQALSITIYSALSINTTSLSDGTVSLSYTQTLTASGGKTPYVWSIATGSFPAGLSLNTSTGVISGTPTTAGTSNFTVRVTDANSAQVSQALSIVIYPALSITTTSLADGTVNLAYSQTLASSGGKSPIAWSITLGSLPAGLSLNGATGVVSGTPITSGTSNFTVQAADANGATATQTLSITIYASLSITTAALSDGTVSFAYSQTLTAGGGKPPLSWTVTLGTLPLGLTLNGSTGVISGTPTTAGTNNFTVQVTDANSATTTRALSITIYSAISLVTTSLNNGTVGAVYSQTITASGGKTPYTWNITAGNLPPGLALNASTGVLSGTPTTAGTYNFTAQVMDANGAAASNPLSIIIYSGLSITTTSLSDGTVNLAYSQTLAVGGGSSPYTWSIIVGSLPAGLTLNSGTGVISGTPTTAGTSNFTVQVTDINSAVATRSLSITIYVALSITTASLPAGTRTAAYSQTIAASGGKTPYAWSVTTGALPAGLALNSATGQISGTPTAAGISNFTIQVSDANGATDSRAFSITINDVPTITTASLSGGTAGTAYSQTLTSSGGTSPLTWSLTLGSLPVGLTLNVSTGVLSGTPTLSATYNFTITLTDSYSVSDSRPYSINIVPGVPAKANILASKTTIVANGTDSAALTVTVRDANDNLVTDGTTVTVTTTNGTVTGITTTLNGVVSRTITGTVSGAAVLGVESPTGTALSTVTGNTSLSFIPGPPAQANIAASKTTVIADGVDQTVLTITVRDANGNLVSDGTTVTLTTALGTVTGTGNTVNGVVTRYLSSIATGTAALGVQSPTGTILASVAGNTSITFSSGVPARAVIAASATTLIANGVDSSTLTVTVYDANNNLVTNGTTVTVTTTLGTVTGTGTTVNGVVTRTITGTISGTAVLGVQSPTGTTLTNVTGNTTIVFNPGPPAQSNISASKTTIIADGVDSTTLTITVRDATGNLVTDGTTVLLTTSLGTVTGSGATALGVVTRVLSGTVSGTANLGVESPVGTPLATVTGNTAIILQPGLPAGTIALSPSPASIVANGVSISTVTSGVIRDAYNNPVLDGTLITVATNRGSITTADASGVNPGIQVTTVSGVTSFVVQSGTLIGTANITAVSVAGSATGNTQIAFVAGTPSAANSSMIAMSPVYSDGVSASTVTITVRDIYNNPVTGSTVVLSSSRGGLDLITQPAGVTDGNGQIIGTVASTSTGDAVITATVNGSVVLTQTATINFYNTQTGTNVTVSASNNTSVTFDMVITIGITTSTQNGTGTALPAGYANPSYFDISTTATFSGNVTICITYNEATYAVREGLVKILHKEGGVLIDRTTFVNTATNTVCGVVTSFSEFAIASTAATNLQVTTLSQAVVSGDVSSVVQVEAKDNNGATDTGYSGTANVSSNSSTLRVDANSNGTFSQTSISINIVNGVGTFYFKDTVVGTPTITVTDAAVILSPASQQETITPAAPSGVITLTPVPGSIVADGAATSTVTSGVIRDVYGNSVSNGTLITVATNLGTITTADVSGTYSGIQLATVNGVISFVVQSGTWVGTANVTAAGVQGSASGNTQIIFLPGLPSGAITLSPTPGSIVADGTATSTVTSGVITDVNGNTVSNGTLITVATDRGTITTADVSGADPGIQVATVSGVISYVVRSGTVSGIANVTAASVQGSASGNAQIIFLPGLPSGTITLTPSPASIIADGAATSTVTSGVITDVYGNTVSDGTLITVATDRGTITTADASGAYAGTQVATISGAISFVVRSGTVSGTANVTAASVAGSAAGSTTIAFISGLPYGTINLTPNPAIIPADGVSTSIITSGVITDINGNTVSDGTLITVATDRGTITTADAGGAYTGVQVTTNSGIITFTLRAGTTEGIATVTAISVQGSANGQATVTLTNVPPELNYPFETGYGNGDAIDPDSGIRSSVYTYKIIYRDVNNNPPAYIRLCIDSSPCTAMGLDTAAIDPSLRDGNYDNGEQYLYTINTLNSGDHAYYIETSDGLAYTKLPPAGSLNGPYVNYPPELSYSLEPGYVTDGVDPDTGNITATFNFKVVYRDLDNQAPASIRVCIDGICYAMSLDASASATLRDSDYRNYEQYVYSTLLSDGTHNYYFDTSDSLEGALLPTSGNLIGPIVTNTYTPVGTNVVVRPDPDVTVTFTQVTAIGDTYVTRSQTGSPLPSGYLQGIPPAYFDIWTTATYTGKVKICYTYDDIQYFGIGYGGERGLRLLHYESGSFKDRTVVLDVNNNMVCGEVYSFSEFSAAVEQATLVTLTSFMAMGMNGKVLLTWATASEVDSMGFNILRGASPDGPFTRINDWVIRSKGTSTRGMAYTYEDIDVKNGTTYFYRLENVDINGRIAAHMIASATLAAPPLAEEKPQSSETLSSAAPGPETAPPGEEILTGHPAPEAPAGGIIYREIPAVIGGEPPPAISEPPVNSAEGENIVPETDTGKEAVEAMPRIGDRVPEERRGISEPEAPEGKRGAPKGFTLKIADDEGNEMEVSLPEETENVQEPFELTVAENNKISLRWSAKGNLKGFNVLRGEGKEKAKEYIRVNVLPIPFFASQSGDQGLVYHFKDAGAGQGKVYSYKVETIFSDGTSRESRSIEISILGTGNAN
ncbi:MAG: putative Ig domain-containing protein, partial [Nitrospirae bacterium]|nr:putative Ig domain-containing protein [Nitrospirota bacterium]